MHKQLQLRKKSVSAYATSTHFNLHPQNIQVFKFSKGCLLSDTKATKLPPSFPKNSAIALSPEMSEILQNWKCYCFPATYTL